MNKKYEIWMYCGINKHKFSILSCYDGHGIIMYYNANNTLHTHETYFSNGIEIIAATFNINIRRAIHVVVIYKPPNWHIFKVFFNH